MNTFLPSRSFIETADLLDMRRLGKQRVEAKQIYEVLTGKRTGWRHHPAVHMWAGYEKALLLYGAVMCQAWRKRGYKDNLMEYFTNEFTYRPGHIIMPRWLGDERLHKSHRAVLLGKNYDYYKQFCWAEKPAYKDEKGRFPYWWPTKSA